MKVDHQPQAEFFNPPGHFQRVLQVIVADVGVDPQPQADGIDAVILENLQAVFGCPIIVIFSARILDLLHIGGIHPVYERSGCGNGGGAGCLRWRRSGRLSRNTASGQGACD